MLSISNDKHCEEHCWSRSVTVHLISLKGTYDLHGSTHCGFPSSKTEVPWVRGSAYCFSESIPDKLFNYFPGCVKHTQWSFCPYWSTRPSPPSSDKENAPSGERWLRRAIGIAKVRQPVYVPVPGYRVLLPYYSGNGKSLGLSKRLSSTRTACKGKYFFFFI